MISDFLKKIGLAAPLEYAGQTAYGLVHPRLLRSGATVSERTRDLPGDDIIKRPLLSLTRAVTIETSIDKVWPWLVQMGYGRGGWYGWYPFNFPHDQSSEQILAEFQSLRVGDVMLDGPGCDSDHGAFTVTDLVPDKAVVLHSHRDVFTGREIRNISDYSKRYSNMSWVFVIEKIANNNTRLLVRTRLAFSRWLALLVGLVLGPGDTVMQRSLIYGIKRRAENNVAVVTLAS